MHEKKKQSQETGEGNSEGNFLRKGTDNTNMLI